MSEAGQKSSSSRELRRGSGRDFISALAIAAIAVLALIGAAGFDSPERWTTAPGLLPIVVGCLLLAMSLVLALSAWRGGAVRELSAWLRGLSQRGSIGIEARRTFVVALAISVYVVLVGLVNFEWRLPTPLFEFAFSSYELVSMAVVTCLFGMFWTGGWLRSVLIAVVGTEFIAWVFRHGFAIPMPAAF